VSADASDGHPGMSHCPSVYSGASLFDTLPPLIASHCLSLPLAISRCLSLPLTISRCLSSPLTASHCLSLPLTASHYLSLPLTASHYLSLPLAASHCLSLPLARNVADKDHFEKLLATKRSDLAAEKQGHEQTQVTGAAGVRAH